MDEPNETCAVEPEGQHSRREMLLKIGAALAACSLGALPAGAQPRRAIRIPRELPTALDKVNPERDFSVFLAIPKDGNPSFVVVDSQKADEVKQLQRVFGATPARARVVGGIVQVDLGNIRADRICGVGSGAVAASPRPGPMPEAVVQRAQIRLR